MVTVRLLAAIKEKNSPDIDHQKTSRFRSTLLYLSSEYRNLRHIIPLKILTATVISNLFYRLFFVSTFNAIRLKFKKISQS